MERKDRTPRVLYLDIARGFAVLFMFTQHCMLIHESEAGDSEHLLSVIFTLLGTAPAAPVFMIIMGVFQMKSRASLRKQILRGVKLFALGLLLNLLRLPMLAAPGANGEVLFRETVRHLLVFNDILQLAGLSCILGALIRPLLTRRVFPPVLLAVILLVSPRLWGLFPDNPLLLMLWGTGEMINFPLFPWMVYPFLGMYLSSFLLEGEETLDRRLNRLAFLGLAFICAGEILIFFNLVPLGDYSRSGLGVHLLMTGFVFVWLGLCRLMEQSFPPGSRFFGLLSFLSLNITTVYFIQWILFAWSIIPLGVNRQSPWIAALSGLAVFLLTLILVRLKAAAADLFIRKGIKKIL